MTIKTLRTCSNHRKCRTYSDIRRSHWAYSKARIQETKRSPRRRNDMLRDIRFAFRVLASRPAFTFVAALSLALGIGANAAIFSLIDALWFRPLAVPDAGRIVRVYGVTGQDREALLSYPEYLDVARQATTIGDLVAIGGRGAILIDGDARQLLTLNLVSSNFFTVLGIAPALGRVFTPQDEVNGSGALVVVLGDSLWRRQFGADPAIVGKQIGIQRAHDVLATVIGVLPKTFRGIETGGDRELWFPRQSWAQLGDIKELESRANRWFRVIGRLANGASARSANAQMQAIAQRMQQTWPATNFGRRLSAVPDLQHRLERAGTNGVALLAIVLLVVMISSVNVANLLLSRAGFRGREMAMRLALGAGRARLVRQLMTENTLLGLAGLMLGLAIAAALTAILPALVLQPPGLHVSLDFEFDRRVVVFTLAVSFTTVVLFGLAPAWRSTCPDLLPALKGEAAFGQPRRWPLRNWLAVAQVAISMTLLACAGVLAQSFANTRTGDLGFARKELLLVVLSTDAKPALYRGVMARFKALPGVRSVAIAVRAPLSLSSNGMFQRVTFPGRSEFAGEPPFEIKYNAITANFLSTMGTPLLRGRGFGSSDETSGATSVLINERMAQRFWPDQDPVGQVVAVRGVPHTIIGVVKNTPINEVGEPPEPYLYLSYWANFEREATFMIETAGDAITLATAARRALKSVDPRLDTLTMTTQTDLVRFSAQKYQVTAELVGALGLLGLILTAVGIYGVVSFGVSQRTRELGIRMALGADRAATLFLVLREVALIGFLGIIAGLPIALTATRMFAALLFGIDPWHAPAFGAAGVLLICMLLAAGILPARRAMALEPGAALRTT